MEQHISNMLSYRRSRSDGSAIQPYFPIVGFGNRTRCGSWGSLAGWGSVHVLVSACDCDDYFSPGSFLAIRRHIFAPMLQLSPLNLFSPLSLLKPLSPLASLSPMVTIGDIPFRWTFQRAHRHRTSPMEPFKWRHWSPMVIAIGSNGDRHWCQWRWGAPLAPLRSSLLEPMDRHWLHLLSPLAPMALMARTPNRYDPFTGNFDELLNSEQL